MVEIIIRYLDEVDPDEKFRQYQAQFPVEEKKAESLRQQQDLQAVQKIITDIGNASDRACEQVLDHEDEISEADAEAQALLAALNEFRDYLKPQGVINTGKHFNMQLFIDASRLYQNYDMFAGDSPKNNLCWLKVIGYIQRFLPACYAQALAKGIYHIVEVGEELRRSFEFHYGGGSYFPLDSDLNFRLGYNYAHGTGKRLASLWALVGLQNYVEQKQQHCKELFNNPTINPKRSV
ncbi:hypothetical protein [Coxiella burnetii]|uniref:hypothetical protein n=1 Tax=Coxiella burnetii TaxID=777 RepID=UPI0000DADFAE|nr:hypothetical protein [Coxiella burnetii]